MDNGYERGKIYVIRSHKTPLIYVGSTIEPLLSNRLSKHKGHYKRYKNGRNVSYCASYDIIEIDEDCYIELYEDYPCENRQQLRKREGQVIRELDCINKVVAGRTRKEHYNENKERLLAISREWRENNPEYHKQHGKKYNKQYYLDNKEKLKEKSHQWYENNKEKVRERDRQYRENNKEKIREQGRQYREKNKKIINAKQNQKYNCECGGKYTRCHKTNHMKTKKHRDYMEFMYN